MPLLFSYGALQDETVQLATFGRRLAGKRDELVGCEPAQVRIDDPQISSRLRTTHHANLRFNGDDASRVAGMVFEVTEAELAGVDEYESAFAYTRVAGILASGRRAWVYVHADTAPSE
jgi:hypothetical protein